MVAMISICTVRSIGEASRKLSSRKVRNLSDGVTKKSNETRVGKVKEVRDGAHADLECKRRTFRLTASPKRGCDGGRLLSKCSISSLKILILSV